MQGFSEEANEMYLKVNINSLKTAIAHIERSTIMSIKLDGGTNYCGGPCIVIKLETQLAAVAQSRKVYQQVPITVIAHRRWSEFEEGDLPEADVSAYCVLLTSIYYYYSVIWINLYYTI